MNSAEKSFLVSLARGGCCIALSDCILSFLSAAISPGTTTTVDGGINFTRNP